MTNTSRGAKQLLLPDWYDHLLAILAIILMIAVVAAVVNGRDQWSMISW